MSWLGLEHSAIVGMVILVAGVCMAGERPVVAVTAAPDSGHVYTGRLGGQPITMVLYLDGDGAGEISGSYSAARRGPPLLLRGRSDRQGRLMLTESDGSQRVTGSLAGTIDGACLAGSWNAADGSRTATLKACELGKRAALSRAVGSYALQSVHGTAFADAVIGMEKRQGKWEVGGTVLVGGTRQAADFALGRGDRRVLDSLRIEVSRDLSIRLRAGQAEIARIAFKNDGMDYGLDKETAAGVALGTRLERLSPTTTFHGGRLFLCALSEVDLSSTGDSRYFAPEGSLIVSYLPVADVFEVSMASLDRLVFARANRP